MAVSKIDTRIARLDEAGLGVLRYGVAFLLVVIGASKFTPWEAAAIEPLVRNSPLLSWLPSALGLRGASDVIGTIEIAIGLAIAARRLAPAISAVRAPGMRAAVARWQAGAISWSREGIRQRTGRRSLPTQGRESKRVMAKPTSWCRSTSRLSSASQSQAECSGGTAPQPVR